MSSNASLGFRKIRFRWAGQEYKAPVLGVWPGEFVHGQKASAAYYVGLVCARNSHLGSNGWPGGKNNDINRAISAQISLQNDEFAVDGAEIIKCSDLPIAL